MSTPPLWLSTPPRHTQVMLDKISNYIIDNIRSLVVTGNGQLQPSSSHTGVTGSHLSIILLHMAKGEVRILFAVQCKREGHRGEGGITLGKENGSASQSHCLHANGEVTYS